MDEQTMRVEYGKAKASLQEAETAFQKARNIYSAMFQLLKAHGFEPDQKSPAEAAPASLAAVDEDNPARTEYIRENLPKAGTFSVDDVLVSGELDKKHREAVALILWKMAQRGELKTVEKGTSQKAASYSRP